MLMKAVVYSEYGSPDVLKLKDVPIPVPKDNELLIKVHATTATTAEGLMRRGEPLAGRIVLGIAKPKRQILGLELSGEVEAVGKDVKRFKKGDQVFGFTGFGAAAYAQYVCVPESASLAVKPANASHEESAALVDGATTALFFLRDKGKIQPGQKVLIYGASGSIGTSAVQLAKYFGAEVTGVCSTANVELVKSLGADKVIDYTKEDFAGNGDAYDIIFDTVGKSSFSRCKPALKEGGRYLVTVMGFDAIFQTLWTSLIGKRKAIFAMSIEKNEALAFIKKLMEERKIKTVIDRSYALEQMAEAHRYVDTGHKKGNVVISVGHN